MTADIASGHVALADVLFLLAAVLFALATIETIAKTSTHFAPLCVHAGLTLAAVALFVL